MDEIHAPVPEGTPNGSSLAVGILVAAYIVVFTMLIPFANSETVASLALTPLVVASGAIFAVKLAAGESDPWVQRVMLAGYALKVGASAAFYVLVFHGPGGDAAQYHLAGADLARSLWSGDFSALIGRGLHGTAAMETLTGILYAVTTPSPVVGFAVFATLSFVGSYHFYRAFRLMVPEGDVRLYAGLVFILPSMLFWPASLGKEAWMILMLGLASHGAARVLAGRPGVLLLLVGVAGIGVVRPHMAALTVAALAAAPLVPMRRGLSRKQRRGRWVLLAIVLAAGGLATIAAQRTFGLSSVGPESVVGFLEVVSENTGRGGSQFSNVQTVNPLLSPIALASVLLRPFPYETSNPTMLLASLESMFVVALLARRRRSIMAALRSTLRDPFVTYTMVYTALFSLSYSFFNNLGLLARERVQLLPVFFVLVAFRYRPSRRNGTSEPISRLATALEER